MMLFFLSWAYLFTVESLSLSSSLIGPNGALTSRGAGRGRKVFGPGGPSDPVGVRGLGPGSRRLQEGAARRPRGGAAQRHFVEGWGCVSIRESRPDARRWRAVLALASLVGHARVWMARQTLSLSLLALRRVARSLSQLEGILCRRV